MVKPWAGINVRFAAHIAASHLPIMPAVFGIDVTVSATIVHFAGITGVHHDASLAVANRVNFVLCERLAFLVFRMDKEDERGYEEGNEIVGIRFHVHSLLLTTQLICPARLVSYESRKANVRAGSGCSVWLGEVLVCVKRFPSDPSTQVSGNLATVSVSTSPCRRTRTGRQCCRPSIPSGMNSRTVLDRAVGRPTTSCRRPC